MTHTTTAHTTAITALQHIAAGHDTICLDCGWTGTGLDLVTDDEPLSVYRVCPICGNLPIKGHRHIAAYALRQIDGGGE